MITIIADPLVTYVQQGRQSILPVVVNYSPIPLAKFCILTTDSKNKVETNCKQCKHADKLLMVQFVAYQYIILTAYLSFALSVHQSFSAINSISTLICSFQK